MKSLAILSLVFLPLISIGDREQIRAFHEAWAAAGFDVELQSEAILSLKGADSDEVARILVKILGAKEIPFSVEDAVIEVLRTLKSEPAVRRLAKEVRSHSRWQARVIIAKALRLLRNPLALEGLHKGLKHPRWAVRSAVVGAIGATRSKDSIAVLIKQLKKEDGRVAGEIHKALRRITGKDMAHLEEWQTWWKWAKEKFKVPPTKTSKPRPVVDQGNTVTKSIYGEVISKKLIFVIDISESMKVVLTDGPDRGLSRMQIMKRELTRAVLWALPEKAEFNVIAYATDVLPWKKELVESTQKNRDAACAWVERLERSGETNVMAALDVALGEKDIDTIYFLSDGSPSTGRITNVQDILKEVRRQNGARNVVINTIALLGGDGKLYKLVEAKPMARSFLKDLASQNEGTFTAFE
ncbi:MAG: HEAT repeat domain-containing protein [Planctomycetota bacterium]|nr:HEAT repeat domain-containing protein [Planctomycetota bacterium]